MWSGQVHVRSLQFSPTVGHQIWVSHKISLSKTCNHTIFATVTLFAVISSSMVRHQVMEVPKCKSRSDSARKYLHMAMAFGYWTRYMKLTNIPVHTTMVVI